MRFNEKHRIVYMILTTPVRLFKKDPITNRGISDLAKALIPAKLWVCLNLTYVIGNILEFAYVFRRASEILA